MSSGAESGGLSGWQRTPLKERLAWVRRFRKAVASAEAELTGLMQDEIGKPRFEGLTADVLPVLASCRWHERRARRVLRTRGLSGGGVIGIGKRVRVARAPVGRVGIIATWNYPVGLLGVQMVQALTAGNDVVVKPSERSPRVQRRLIEIGLACGLPAGALEVIGHEREAGARMLSEGAFDHVVFTGSTGVGRRVAERLAPSLTTSTLELSGRDSAFVLGDADCRLAARTVWWAVSQNSGQTCMAPRRVLVDRRAYPAFVRELGLHAAAASPRKMIDGGAAAAAFEQALDAAARGGRSISGVLEEPVVTAGGAWLRPIAIVDCPADAPLVEGRHFGPVVAVVPVDDVSAALAIHRACDQHLAASVYTAKPGRASDLAASLGASVVTFNDTVMPTAHPAASVGGVGASGWGQSQGEAGLLAMTRPVTVTRTSGWLRPPLSVPTADQVDQMAARLTRFYGGTAGAGVTASRGPGPDRAAEGRSDGAAGGEPVRSGVDPIESAAAEASCPPADPVEGSLVRSVRLAIETETDGDERAERRGDERVQ